MDVEWAQVKKRLIFYKVLVAAAIAAAERRMQVSSTQALEGPILHTASEATL